MLDVVKFDEKIKQFGAYVQLYGIGLVLYDGGVILACD